MERSREVGSHRVVFVDEECGTYTAMTSLRIRAPECERVYGPVPPNRGKNTTLIASMGAGGMGPGPTVEGATTNVVFEAYVEWVLARSLSAGQVVVGDNLGAHKGSGFSGWSRGEALLEVIGMAFS